MGKAFSDYDLSVFINCPFDAGYRPIFNALVFAVFDCGFIPRSALEAEDEPRRLDRIMEIIAQSRLSIHDLSRARADRKSGFARFNMPFELGLFLGAREYGTGRHSLKSFTLFDKERFRYQKFISDLNGIDPRPHGMRISDAVRNVRIFIQNQSYVDFQIPGPEKILERYSTFRRRLPKLAFQAGHKHTDLTYVDYCFFVQEWLEAVAP